MSRRSEKTSIESALEAEKDKLRNYFLRYTRKAFRILPKIKAPQILDVDCGSGTPTLELAKLSNGKVTGIDIDQSSLNKLTEKIREKGLSNKVFTERCSLLNIDFPKETFDIIWAEGVIHTIGFERGLKELRRLLRQAGFLVIHDGVKYISNKIKKTTDLGYTLIDYFTLPNDAWWVHYFEPLERLIEEHRKKAKNKKSLNILTKFQTEVEMYKSNPKGNISAFYIFQKKN